MTDFDTNKLRNCILCDKNDTVMVRNDGESKVVKCRSCGLVYRNPDRAGVDMKLIVPPDPGILAIHAEKFRSSQRHIMKLGLDMVEKVIRPPGRMLDVGSGYGDILFAARDRGWDVSGLDISANSIAVCRQAGFDVFHGKLEELAPLPGSYDVVVLNQVLDHFENPLKELVLILTALNPGGVILVRANNNQFHEGSHRIYKHFKKLFDMASLSDISTFHKFCFSVKTFRDCVERAGFHVVSVKPSPAKKDDPNEYLGKSFLRKVLTPISIVFHAITNAVFLLSAGKLILSSSFMAVCQKQS